MSDDLGFEMKTVEGSVRGRGKTHKGCPVLWLSGNAFGGGRDSMSIPVLDPDMAEDLAGKLLKWAKEARTPLTPAQVGALLAEEGLERNDIVRAANFSRQIPEGDPLGNALYMACQSDEFTHDIYVMWGEGRLGEYLAAAYSAISGDEAWLDEARSRLVRAVNHSTWSSDETRTAFWGRIQDAKP